MYFLWHLTINVRIQICCIQFKKNTKFAVILTEKIPLRRTLTNVMYSMFTNFHKNNFIVTNRTHSSLF